MPSGVQIRRALRRVEAIIAAQDRGAVSCAIREFTTDQHPGGAVTGRRRATS